MALPKLRPCPLCGGEAQLMPKMRGTVNSSPYRFNNVYELGCPRCCISMGSLGYVSFDYSIESGPVCDESQLIALINKWNQRTEGGDPR